MQFPHTVEEITADWLTRSLAAHIGSAAVTDFELKTLVGGYSGSVVRATLRYDKVEPGAPETLVLKLPSSDEKALEMYAALDFYAQEYRFYRELAPIAGINLAKQYFVQTNAAGTVGVIGLEDLGHLRNPMPGFCTRDDGLAAVRAMAGMHAKWWGSPSLMKYDWLFHPGVLLTGQTKEDLSTSIDAIGHLLSDGTKAVLAELPNGISKIEHAWGSEPTTLCMGDSRAANWFFEGTGEATRAIAIDWQTPSRYSGATDIAYFLALGFSAKDRRSHEREMISAYHDALIEGGVTGYSADQLDEDFRWGLFRALITFARVIGSLNVSDDNLALVEDRLQSLQDWECIELLK